MTDDELGVLGGLQEIVRLGADQVALMRQFGDRIGTGRSGEEGLALPAHRRHRRGHRRGPGAHDHRHLVHVDQLARGAHRGLRVGLVVFHHQFDLATEHAAGGVDLGGDGLHRLQHARAVERAGAGQRRQHAELQFCALRPRCAWCGQWGGQRGGAQHSGTA